MNLLVGLLIILFAFLLTVTLTLLLIGPTILLQPARRRGDFYKKLKHPISPEELRLNYEEINVITNDGIKLNSWLIKSSQQSLGTIIYLHGVGDCKIAGISFAKFFRDNGFNVFLYDSRRHGESGGNYCTYGFYEKHDLIRVIDYIESRKDLNTSNIGLFGSSMGAAVAIQTAAIDKRIKAVVAENSFSTLRKIFDDYQKRIVKIPFHYLRNLVITRSEFMANFKAREVSPLRAIADVHIPILFAYAKLDKHINYKYSIQLYENTDEPKELFPLDNSSHNDTWELGGEKYHNKLLEFFGRTLS